MTLGDVHVNRDGTIRYDGEPIGWVEKVDIAAGWRPGTWRCEIGDASKPEEWPSYRVCYQATRKAAVGDALADLEHPTA